MQNSRLLSIWEVTLTLILTIHSGCFSERIDVDLTGSVDLPCRKPDGEEVAWFYNQNDVIFVGQTYMKTDKNKFQLQTKYQNDRTLRINSIKVKDEGNYTCKSSQNKQIETYTVVIRAKSIDGTESTKAISDTPILDSTSSAYTLYNISTENTVFDNSIEITSSISMSTSVDRTSTVTAENGGVNSDTGTAESSLILTISTFFLSNFFL